MAARAIRAPRLALSGFRQPARRFVSAHQGPKAKAGSSDLPWMVGSAAVFGPTLFYLLGPNAPGKHDSHDDHLDHKDDGRGVYSRTSREPKWSDEDEELDRLRNKGEDDEEEEAEEEEGSSDEDSEGPATPAGSDDEEGGDKDEGGDEEEGKEKKGRPLQADVQSSRSNRTPRNADPDKLQFAAQHGQRQHEGDDGGADPKKMIEEMREKKKQGDTSGEATMRGDRTDQVTGDDAQSDRAKEARAKDKGDQ